MIGEGVFWCIEPLADKWDRLWLHTLWLDAVSALLTRINVYVGRPRNMVRPPGCSKSTAKVFECLRELLTACNVTYTHFTYRDVALLLQKKQKKKPSGFMNMHISIPAWVCLVLCCFKFQPLHLFFHFWMTDSRIYWGEKSVWFGLQGEYLHIILMLIGFIVHK